MPPGYEPLLAAVCAAPWDDLPRLVFADWLDDHGEHDRAEFIRLHCQAARLESSDQSARDRAAELVRRYGPSWRSAELPQIDGVDWGKYRRGFVSSVTFRYAPLFEPHQAEVFAAAPIQQLIVRDVAPEDVGAPLLARLANLTELSLYGQIDDRAGVAVVTSPAAARLEALSVQGVADTGGRCSGLTDQFGRAAAESQHLSRLRLLTVSAEQLSRDVQDALAARFTHGYRWSRRTAPE